MAYMGIYYFNRSSKELLYYNYFIRAALAKYHAPRAFFGPIIFSALFTASTPRLSLFTSKWCCEASPKYK